MDEATQMTKTGLVATCHLNGGSILLVQFTIISGRVGPNRSSLCSRLRKISPQNTFPNGFQFCGELSAKEQINISKRLIKI